eukprot:TRINITY_DN8081_c0_g1_i2.p1 TRINITY_DN8081_c0_g1~~TRINITY_DN8081_c0_g1_i2.p1  ORF type:complete len:249 (+),score=77.87 TRINITY_DN8081_c0_g1_i2:148-894(+)
MATFQSRSSSSSGGGRGASGGLQNVRVTDSGERIIPPSRRPDGTLRKEIRIRAGYTPQDEVVRYAPRQAREAGEDPKGPPGADAEMLNKPLSKSAKKNLARKQKAQLADSQETEDEASSSIRKDSNAPGDGVAPAGGEGGGFGGGGRGGGSAVAASVQQQQQPSSGAQAESKSSSQSEATGEYSVVKPDASTDVEKRIRALRKKVRQAENLASTTAKLTPEEVEKKNKLEEWRQELQQLGNILKQLKV